MSTRIIQCGACGTKYKIPVSFKAAKAKCKNCGAVIEVPQVEASAESAPKAAPKKAAAPAASKAPPKKAAEKPAAKPAPSKRRAAGSRAAAKDSGGEEASSSRPSRAGGSRRGGSARRGARGTAAAEGGGRARGRRGARGEEEKGNNPIVWVAVGGCVIVVAVVAFIMVNSMGGDDETNTPDVTADAKEQQDENTQDETPETDPIPEGETDGGEGDGTDPETPADDGADDASTEKTDPEPPPEPEVLNPVIDFAAMGLEPFPKTPDTTDEEWAAISELINTATTDTGRKGTRAMNRLCKNYEFKAVPALFNALNGLDVTDPIDDATAGFLSTRLTDLFAGVISVGYKTGRDEEDTKFNVKLLTGKGGVLNYWNERVKDTAKYERTLELVAKRKAKKEDE